MNFPNDEADIKLFWLALRNVLALSVRVAFDWKLAMNQFAIPFGDRFTQASESPIYPLPRTEKSGQATCLIACRTSRMRWHYGDAAHGNYLIRFLNNGFAKPAKCVVAAGSTPIEVTL